MSHTEKKPNMKKCISQLHVQRYRFVSRQMVAFNFIHRGVVDFSAVFFFSIRFIRFVCLFACCTLCIVVGVVLTICTFTVLTDAIDDDVDEFHISGMVAVKTVEAIESESIVLSCGRTKMPDDDVKWFFNGKLKC